MRVAGEFSLIFESEVIKSRLVRDANAASISDYVPSPPLPHSSFPSPCSFFFLPPPCTRAFLFFLSLSRIWFTGFLSDADTPQRSVSCFPKGSTRNDKNSKKKWCVKPSSLYRKRSEEFSRGREFRPVQFLAPIGKFEMKFEYLWSRFDSNCSEISAK